MEARSSQQHPPAVPAVDTREPEGPESRTYSAPFARVWDLLLAEIDRRRGWRLVHCDEDLGMLTVACRSLVGRRVDDLIVWVLLDENGLTRVDMRATVRDGGRDFGANRRRVGRLTTYLDGALGAGARVKTP